MQECDRAGNRLLPQEHLPRGPAIRVVIDFVKYELALMDIRDQIDEFGLVRSLTNSR